MSKDKFGNDTSLLDQLESETSLYDTSLLQQLGLDSEDEKDHKDDGLDLFQPIRTAFGATGSVGGKLAGLVAPEAYERAGEEVRAGLGVAEDSPWYEQVEALPGLGDVLAQTVPESVRESLPGRIAGPVARLVGNIAGDPTTYTPAVLGKAAGLIARGVKGARPAVEASLASVRGAEQAARAGQLGRDAVEAIRAEQALNVLGAVRKYGSPVQAKAYEAASLIRELDPIAQAGLGAVAYGPQVVESAWDSLKDTLTADSASEALVSGANTILMAGLGALMAKGLKNVTEAKEILGRAVRQTEGVPEPTRPAEATEVRPEPPAPGEVPPVEPGSRAAAETPSPEEVARVQGEDEAVQDLLAQRAEAQAAQDEAVISALERAEATPSEALRAVETPPDSTLPFRGLPPDETLPLPPRAEIQAPETRQEAPTPVSEVVPPDVELAQRLAEESRPKAAEAVEAQLQAALKGLSPEQAQEVRARFEPERATWETRLHSGEARPKDLRERFRGKTGIRKAVVDTQAERGEIAGVISEEVGRPIYREPAPVGKAGLEVAVERGEVRPELLQAGKKLPKQAKQRIWDVIPEKEQEGVLGRFVEAKKGGEIRSPGGDKPWPVDKNLPRMARFVELLKETGSREEAIKALSKERKTGVRSEGNFVTAFENALGQFYAGERGVEAPGVAARITAEEASALKARKADLDARLPTGKEFDRDQLQAVLRDYQQFVAERKAARARGLGTKDQALWDRKLNQFAKNLGVSFPAGSNADLVIRRIARATGIGLEQRAAAPVKVPARLTRATALWKSATDLPRGSRKDVRIGLQGTRVEFLGDEARLEKIESPEGAAKDVRDLLSDPKVRVVNVGELRQTPKARAALRKALDDALEDSDGNTRAAWRTEGETLVPVRQHSPEVEAPRVEAAHARKGQPNSQLSVPEIQQRLRHYAEDVENGVDLGDGLKVVDHDRRSSPEYVSKVAEISKGLGKPVERLVDELSEIHTENVEFGGFTTSPYLSGLFHDGKIYVNPVEAVHAATSREGAVENMLYTLFHEGAHAQGVGHDPLHRGYARYLERLAKDENRIEGYRKALLEAFPEESYQRVRRELVPEFRQKWEEINGESWRARSEQGVPAWDVEGGAAARTGGDLGGPAALEGGAPPGIERGRTVPGSARVEAGRVRPPAATGRSSSEGAAPREGARPPEWGEAGAEAGRIEVLETRAGASGRGIDLDSAKRLLDEAAERGSRLKVPEQEMHAEAFSLARQVVDGMTPDEMKKAAEAIPDPGKGQLEAQLNLLRLPGISERTRAETKVWYDLTKGKWDRDRVEHWGKIDDDVKKLLGLETPEELVAAIRKRGGGYSSKDIHLLRTITNEFGARIDDAHSRYLEALDSKQPEETLKKLFESWRDTERQYQTAALTTSQASTGVARALAIHKAELTRLDPQEQFRQSVKAHLRERMEDVFKDKVEAAEKTNELFGKLMAGFEEGGSFEEFRRALKLVSKKGARWSKILEWYKAGLLGWPSEIANMAGNTLFRASRFTEDVVAGLLDASASKLTGAERTRYLGENSVALQAMRRSMREGAPKFLKDYIRLFEMKGLDDEALRETLKHGALAGDLMQMAGGAIAGKKGHFIRFHFSAMSLADNLSKHVARTESLYRQVYRKLRAGELKLNSGESIGTATERIVGDLRSNHKAFMEGKEYDYQRLQSFEPMMKTAEEAAKKDTFQEDLPGTLRGFQRIIQQHPSLQFLIPFYRTPVNIARETIKRTPFGFVGTIKNWGKMSQAERVSSLAPPLVGTSIMGLVATAAMNGDVTGGGPVAPEEQAALRAVGWQPYSVRVGDEWYSYQRLEPLASLLGFAADYVEAIKRGETQTGRELAEKAFASLSENLTNKTFLSSITSFLGAVDDPKRDLKGFVKQLQGSAIPNSIGFIPVGHLARALDPVYRQTEAFTGGPFLAKIPGASTILAPQYGPTGEERTRSGSAFERAFSPFQHQTQQSGPKAMATDELVRLSAVPRAPMRYWVSSQGVQVPLTQEEQRLLAKAADSAVQHIGVNLIRDPAYRRLPDNENDPNYRFGAKTKEDVLKKVLQRYRAKAMDQMKGTLKARARKALQERQA